MERGEARETEIWEGRRREDGDRGSTVDREMGGKIAWLYTLQAKLFSENRVRTEKQIGEERSREAKEEIKAVFTAYRGIALSPVWGGNVGRLFVFLEPENHRQWRTLSVMAKGETGHHIY
jgi:hypothetical protein